MLHTRVEESSVTFDHRLDLDGRVHLSDEADSNSRGIKLQVYTLDFTYPFEMENICLYIPHRSFARGRDFSPTTLI